MDHNKLRRAQFERQFDEWTDKHMLDSQIRKLASSYKDGQPCKVGDLHFGSYNAGFPVDFDDGTKWFIRFPMPGQVVCLKEKFLSEIATMKLVQKETKIKIPTVIAWATEGDHPTGSAFMITDFMEGKALGHFRICDLPLDKKEFVYRQLAEVLLDMTDLRCDKIGSWTVKGEKNALALENRPLSFSMNSLLTDGVDVDTILPVEQTFDTSSNYFDCLSRMIRARLEQQQNSIWNEADGRSKACAVYLFESLLPHAGIVQSDDGPFVLMHGDLNRPNIMVNDETLQFNGIIDWEWSRVVPIELVLPPFWLTGMKVHDLAVSSDNSSFFEECGRFIDVMEKLEDSRGYPENYIRLSKVMRNMVESPMKFWLAMCLRHPYDFDHLYWEKVDPLRRHPEQTEDDVEEEFLRGPHKEAVEKLVNQKMADLKKYKDEFEASGCPESAS